MCEVMDGTIRGHMLERKGSLFLRSNHMQYGKRTMVSGWHQNREAEPKDCDFGEIPVGKKNLSRSSYMRFGNSNNEDWTTTTQKHLCQIQTKIDYEVRDVPKQFINEDNCIAVLNMKRPAGYPERGFGSALPYHHKDHRKLYLDTTYAIDYTPPYPYTKGSRKNLNVPDYSPAYKKCHSQFTDTADYRRHGRNTWHDESGIYANSQIKLLLLKPTCPITPYL